jgi:RimJ/RimL family protein N-acetyltransferase
MRSHADRSYFYFWIGADYQGAGLGCRATELLFRQARALGVHEIFTAAYPFNQRSCDSLRRLGFQQVDVVASPPDDDLVFFHRPVDDRSPNAAGAPGRLIDLLSAIESPLGFNRDPAAVPR